MRDSNPFVGTWKLISWEVTQPDGKIHYLYGKDVVGYLIYTADGYMSAEIMDPDHQQSDPNFPLEIAAAQTFRNRIGRGPTAPIYPIAEPTRLRAIR